MSEIGDKIIDGRIVNLDKESIENLERMAKKLEEKEEAVKTELGELMNQMLE